MIVLCTDDWYHLTMSVEIYKPQFLLTWLWYNLPKCLSIISVFMASWTGISPRRIALNTLWTSYCVSSGWKWYLLHTPLGCILGPLLLWQSAHFWKLSMKSTYVCNKIQIVCSVIWSLVVGKTHQWCKLWFIIKDLQLSGRHLACWQLQTRIRMFLRGTMNGALFDYLKAMKASLAVVKVCKGRSQSDLLPYVILSRDRAQPWLEDHPGEQLLIPVPRVSRVVPQA